MLTNLAIDFGTAFRYSAIREWESPEWIVRKHRTRTWDPMIQPLERLVAAFAHIGPLVPDTVRDSVLNAITEPLCASIAREDIHRDRQQDRNQPTVLQLARIARLLSCANRDRSREVVVSDRCESNPFDGVEWTTVERVRRSRYSWMFYSGWPQPDERRLRMWPSLSERPAHVIAQQLEDAQRCSALERRLREFPNRRQDSQGSTLSRFVMASTSLKQRGESNFGAFFDRPRTLSEVHEQANSPSLGVPWLCR
jgi:hypothetical protein